MKRDEFKPREQKRLPGNDEIELPIGLTRVENGLVVSENAASDDLVRYASALQLARVEEGWVMGDLVAALESRGLNDVCASLARGVWTKPRLQVARRVASRFPLETRSFALSYTHYREVATRTENYPSEDLSESEAAPLKDAWMERARHWLRIAAAEALSCAALERRIIEAQEGRAKMLGRDLMDVKRTLSKVVQFIRETPSLHDAGRLSGLVEQFRVLALALDEGILRLLKSGEETDGDAVVTGEVLKFRQAAQEVLEPSLTRRERRPLDSPVGDSIFSRSRPLWQGWPVVAAATLAVALTLPAALGPGPGEKIVVVGLQDPPRRKVLVPAGPRKQATRQPEEVRFSAVQKVSETVLVSSAFQKVTELKLVQVPTEEQRARLRTRQSP